MAVPDEWRHYRPENLATWDDQLPHNSAPRHIIERTDRFPANWGLDAVHLSPDELAALAAGKLLHIDISSGEYALVIGLAEPEHGAVA